MLQPGDALPTFSLHDDRGEPIADTALRAGAVVLYFYPKDDTPGCTRQACDLRDDLSAFAAAGIRTFGVSADDVASHAAFRERFALTFPLIADPTHSLCEAVGVWGEQEWNGHRYHGIARTTFILRDGVVTHVFEDVDVTGHSARVLAAARVEQAR